MRIKTRIKLRTKISIITALSMLLFIVHISPIHTVKAANQEFSISGVAHIQNKGDTSGALSTENGYETLVLGTRGKSLRVEAITLNLTNNTGYDGNIEYQTHIQNVGWQDWKTSGQESGTRGKSLRLEGIRIRLTGELANHYSVRYAVHIQNYGDAQGWVNDGALAGTTGESLRLEEIKIQLIPRAEIKESVDNNATMQVVTNPSVSYRVHRQDYGWEKKWLSNGQCSGTTGQGKRLEGITISINGAAYQGGVEYQTHIQNIGWTSWVADGTMSGTQGKSFRLEAIRIRLTKDLASYYDIYYRVHVQDYGWLGWVRNGELAGTEGESKRLEAIQIVLVNKTDDSSWEIQNYSDITDSQAMFYTIRNRSTGSLIVVDGGTAGNEKYVRKIIGQLGNKVDAWIITHYHADHVPAFNRIYSNPKGIQINRVYAPKFDTNYYKQVAYYWDNPECITEFDKITKDANNVTFLKRDENINICGLNMYVFNSYDDISKQYGAGDIPNNAGLVFKIYTEDTPENTMLFMSDVHNKSMSDMFVERYGSSLEAKYLQSAHHGNNSIPYEFYNIVKPKYALFDAPKWLMTGSNYQAKNLKMYMESNGIKVYDYTSGFHIISLTK